MIAVARHLQAIGEGGEFSYRIVLSFLRIIVRAGALCRQKFAATGRIKTLCRSRHF